MTARFSRCVFLVVFDLVFVFAAVKTKGMPGKAAEQATSSPHPP
jgi:hypothetical protein